MRWLCDENFVLFAVEEYGEGGGQQTVLGTSRIRKPERNASLLAAVE